MMNRRENIVIRTPFDNTEPFTIDSLLKQGTSLGPILNNFSLDDVSIHCDSYQYQSIEIKALEFADDIADANSSHLKHFIVIKLSELDIVKRKGLKL